jgi:hypothetical protein
MQKPRSCDGYLIHHQQLPQHFARSSVIVFLLLCGFVPGACVVAHHDRPVRLFGVRSDHRSIGVALSGTNVVGK